MASYIVNIVNCTCVPSDGFECLGYSVVIEDNSNQLIVGNVYSLSGITLPCRIPPCQAGIPYGCYRVEDFQLTPRPSTPTAIIVNSYGPQNPSGCEDCLNAISNYVIFKPCFEGGELPIPINQITPPYPNIGDVFFLEYYVSFSEMGSYFDRACYKYQGLTYIDPNKQFIPPTILTVFSAQTDCQTCLSTSPLVYEVEDCSSGFIIYVALPTSNLERHLITYTDLAQLTQFCGIVGKTASTTTTGIFVTDLGVFNPQAGIDCDYCLSFNNDKRLLVNCLDNTTEVVWASNLFDVGNSTHLSIGNGCYQVSGIADPMSAVTINELANYDPQKDCEDCLECYGVIYDFITCEPLEICGPQNFISTTAQGYGGGDFAITNSDRAFVPLLNDSRIIEVNLLSQTILQTSSNILSQPRSLDIDESNGVVCVAPGASNQVCFFDSSNLSNYSFVGNATTINPRKVYFNSNDGFFYVVYGGCCGNIDLPIRVYSGTSYSTMAEINSFGNMNNSYSDIVQVGSTFYALNLNGSIDVFDSSYTYQGNFIIPYTPKSLDVDGTTIYIATNNSVYVKFDTLSSGYTFHPFTTFCSGNFEEIKFDSLNNKLYITDQGCNHIYEIDATTNTLLKTYDNLNSSNISQVWGIDIDTSGNVWFSSYDKLFNLGCTTDFVTGQTSSNEYLSASTVFFNTQLSACCEITNVTSITDVGFLNLTQYISMLHYQDCETCTGSTKDIFYVELCGSGFGGILMAPQGDYSIGQYVRSQFGNSDWLCFQIIDYADNSQNNSNFSFIASGPGFNTCEECTSGATLGLTLINCDTQNALQVNVTLNDWSQIIGFPFQTPLSVVSDINGTCYQVVNACPIDNVYPPFEVQNYYFNQSFCGVGNRTIPLDPISAGTEYLACQICCPCESGGTINQISVPHPQWTNGQGRTIVLLDAVRLGGMNGLNS
jgi:hypothetical protein